MGPVGTYAGSMAAPSHLRDSYFQPDMDVPPAVSLVERALVCDTFERVGPDAPTLAGAWKTHQLAAHLIVRERSPLGSAMAAIPRFGDSEVESLVGRGDFYGLVDALRSGPPRLSLFGWDATDRNLNTLEFFIHHEDVLRAATPSTPRQLPRWAEDQIWWRLKIFAKMTMRHSDVPVALQRCDDPHEPSSTASKGPHPVVVLGLPSELAMFAYGRGAVASVELTGRAAAVKKLRAARFGL